MTSLRSSDRIETGIMRVFGDRSRAWLPIVVWTALVWVSRLRNVWADEDLSVGGQVLRTGFAVVFLALAAAAVVVLRAARARSLGGFDRVALWTFVAWTVGFWLVRGIGIIVDDHTAGFTAIHTALMVVSLALAAVAARELVAPRRRAAISASQVG